VRPSTGSAGDWDDNAMCENFFATLECELTERRAFTDSNEAERQLFSYMQGFHRSSRRHSPIEYDAPMDYEKQATSTATEDEIP
jgi:putative transposase